jgi:cysteine-S-conjugate beta-lyase
MTSYDFDALVDFASLLSKKWSFKKQLAGTEDVIPMWIADMDFRTAPCITEALTKRARGFVYGYAAVPESYNEALVNWFRTRHNWTIDPKTVLQIPGVVPALHVATEAFTMPGDYILMQTPVYHPFYRVANNMGRKILENPLKRLNDRYTVDFLDLEEKLKTYKPKIMFLCNPHNPVGKVFTKEELVAIGKLCIKYEVITIVDEIHCDIVYSDAKHIPYAAISEEFAENAIICTAASKTFNIAGLRNSNIVIPSMKLRVAFTKAHAYFGYPGTGPFPLIACEAAYSGGAQWQDECIKYLQENRDLAIGFFHAQLPKISVHKPQGTYFLWLDFSAYGFMPKELEKFLLFEAKIWLNQGNIFGDAGIGYARMNIACTRATLTKALKQLKAALDKSIVLSNKESENDEI